MAKAAAAAVAAAVAAAIDANGNNNKVGSHCFGFLKQFLGTLNSKIV